MHGSVQTRALAATVLIAAMLSNSAPAEEARQQSWMDVVLAQAAPATPQPAPPDGSGPASGRVDVFPEADEPLDLQEDLRPSPLTFSIKYGFMTDRVFRGINRTEFRQERHERPNHQLEFNFETDIGYWLENSMFVGVDVRLNIFRTSFRFIMKRRY